MREFTVAPIIYDSLGNGQYVLPNWEGDVALQETENKRKLLARFFTNTDKNVFAIKSEMPSVLAAALIARFSRANESDIRELFWKEFVTEPELGVKWVSREIYQSEGIEETLANKKARDLIRRILDRFGDDSVREQASAHVMVQDGSVLLSMETFREPLLTGIEASTRYINWGEKVDGEYRYSVPEKILNSNHKEVYLESFENLFETYRDLWDEVWNFVVKKNPQDKNVSDLAYQTAVKGRVCDNLRKLLPLSIKTNFGLHAKFRTLGELILQLRASELEESRLTGDRIAEELAKINPEFIGMVEGKHGILWTNYLGEVNKTLKGFVHERDDTGPGRTMKKRVIFEILNKDYMFDLAKGMHLAAGTNLNESDLHIFSYHLVRSGEAVKMLRETFAERKNRRHKVPNFLGRVVVRMKFEKISFAGAKDLNRHRKLLDKPDFDWTAGSGYYIPDDIAEMGGKTLSRYKEAQERAQDTYHIVGKDFPVDARGILTHGTNTTIEIVAGLDEAIWIEELRTIASGDPEYRWFAQELYRQRVKSMPEFKDFLTFVDLNDYKVGRISEAVRADLKGKN